MPRRKLSLSLAKTVTTLTLAMLLATASASAQTLTILHDFLRNGVDGEGPQNGLIFDSAGNLYGGTGGGGAYSEGTAFELLPKAGTWGEKIIHNFDPNINSDDGTGFNGPLVMDSEGNFYGTTQEGPVLGESIKNNGVVYELVRHASGGFSELVLYVFKGSLTTVKDGTQPWGNLIFDSAGNLYGTTRGGGTYGWGTVFEVSPTGLGTWTEKVLYSFDNAGDSGCEPFGGLALDSAGNLYGTTNACGANGDGTVYKLSQSGGVWTQTVLHAFTGYTGVIDDGASPYSGVVFDSAGNLYGVTQLGGLHTGVAYELSPQPDGSWTETILYNFGASGDGSYPFYAPVFDSSGNLYGTCGQGGTKDGGTVYKLVPSSSGTWTETTLYNFSTSGTNYNEPTSGVILDSQGNLYGELQYGGSEDGGGAYKLTP
jgi:uncharacterized repeat protein (TIGR03803 family)